MADVVRHDDEGIGGDAAVTESGIESLCQPLTSDIGVGQGNDVTREIDGPSTSTSSPCLRRLAGRIMRSSMVCVKFFAVLSLLLVVSSVFAAPIPVSSRDKIASRDFHLEKRSVPGVQDLHGRRAAFWREEPSATTATSGATPSGGGSDASGSRSSSNTTSTPDSTSNSTESGGHSGKKHGGGMMPPHTSGGGHGSVGNSTTSDGSSDGNNSTSGSSSSTNSTTGNSTSASSGSGSTSTDGSSSDSSSTTTGSSSTASPTASSDTTRRSNPQDIADSLRTRKRTAPLDVRSKPKDVRSWAAERYRRDLMGGADIFGGVVQAVKRRAMSLKSANKARAVASETTARSESTDVASRAAAWAAKRRRSEILGIDIFDFH
ncbi:hypothetical protein FISHEDRAFT_75235 [Fistulina hepatica ATCC 64428]|uniref:Uncharacterized protein n=1 Tax=Fistulina hepatica ATCC 64428 TaxID=1128425 RepID=A0A0D7A7X0_9AGAR|nr:hypothetical protein FISHEDRAFT_75235 [Fistulina hepatica ATCC 64428]